MEINNNYFKIENNVAEALARINLSEYESRLLWVVMRKTWGWNKEKDKISFSQFEKESGINRCNAFPTLKRLAQKNIIKVLKEGRTNMYCINRDASTWSNGKVRSVISNNNMAANNSVAPNNKPLLQATIFPLSAVINTKEIEKTTKQKTNINSSTNSNNPVKQTPIQQLVAYYKYFYKEKFNQEPVIGTSSWGKWGKLLKIKLEQGYSLKEIAILLQTFSKSKDSNPDRLGFDLGIFFSDSIFNKIRSFKERTSCINNLEDKYGKY